MRFPDNLDDISDVLSNDGVILYPTDTIWGLGCNPFSIKAINKLFELKKRDKSKGLLLLVDSIEMLKEHVYEIHPRVETLLVYHNKPLTIIYPEPKNLPNELMGSFKSIGIRLVNDPFCQALIKHLGHPITSTSANFAGDPFPKIFKDIDPSLINECDYVVNHRQSDVKEGTPSVIVTYDTKGQINFLRN